MVELSPPSPVETCYDTNSPADDPRLDDPAYAHFYYSQRPIDPRLPRPRLTREALQFHNFAPSLAYFGRLHTPMSTANQQHEEEEEEEEISWYNTPKTDTRAHLGQFEAPHVSWGPGYGMSEHVPGAGSPEAREVQRRLFCGNAPCYPNFPRHESKQNMFPTATGMMLPPNLGCSVPLCTAPMTSMSHAQQHLLCHPQVMPHTLSQQPPQRPSLVIPQRPVDQDIPPPAPLPRCAPSPHGEKKALRADHRQHHPSVVSKPSKWRNSEEVVTTSPGRISSHLEEFHALLAGLKRERTKQKRQRKLASSNASSPQTPPETPSPTESVKSESSFKSETSMLDDFLTMASDRWTLGKLAGHLPEFARDQVGSRFLQKCLDAAGEAEFQQAAHELSPHASSLIVDAYGNYVVQRLLERSTPEQRRALVSAVLTPQALIPLCKGEYGCRVVAKMLEVAARDQQEIIMQRLRQEDVKSLVMDAHANHVMQKLVETQSEAKKEFVVQYFAGRAVKSATNKYACRVLLKIIEHGGTSEAVRSLLQELLPHITQLMDDQFANYVVQTILEFGTPEEVQAVISTLSGHYVSMSMQKFASNVVERVLRVATVEQRVHIISEILDGKSFTLDHELGDGEEAQGLRGVAVSPLVAIMVHPYGNYVVQRMMEYGSPEQQLKIVGRVKELAAGLERGKFGKHILASLEAELNSWSVMLGTSTSA